MNLDKQYKVYKMMNTIKRLNKTLWLLNYLVPLFHLFCIIFFMLLNILPQIAVSFDTVAQILITIKDNYLTIDLANVYFIVGLLITFFLAVLGMLRLKVMPNYDELSEHKKLQKFLFIGSVTLGYAYQVGIFFFAWSFSQIFNHEGLIFAILKCIIPLAGYIFFTRKYTTNSLYGWLTVPITILITILDNPVSYIIVILISFYLIMQEKIMMKKIFCGFVALVALFVMKNSQLFQETGTDQMQISFICLGILAVLTPVFIIHIKQKLDITNSEDKIQNCYTVLNQLKADSPHQQMKFEDFYQLYNTIATFSLSNKDQKSIQVDLILQKDPQKISKKEFLFLLEKYLEGQCRNASQSNVIKQIYLFKIKAQLQYSPYSIILDMHNLNEQIQRGNNKVYQQQIFQIFDQIISKFALVKNGYLEPAYLIHLNKLHQDFQNKVYLMLDRFQNFWRQIAEDQIRLLALDSYFEEVLEIQNDIEQLYINIDKFGYFQREKKIIDITRSLYNVYQEVNKYSRQGKKKAQSTDRDFTHAFVILENGAIKFISKDLMKTLGKKGTLSYENIDKKILFGKDFSMIIDELTKNISASSQNQYNSVPVLAQSGVMQLKNIRIMWYPSLEVKSRIIITFSQDMELVHQAYLIYHFKSDTIKYFNEKFIKMFKIDQQRFINQIENYQLFFNELFIQTDIPAEEIKNYLKEQNTIKCKIYLKNYVEKGKLPSLPVQVKVLRCIEVNNQPTHCILKVSKIKQKNDNIVVDPSTQMNLQRKQFYQQKQVVSTTENALVRKWADEKFFCKIPNHFQSKISEKQAQLEEKNRWVCRYYIHLLFAVAFLTVSIIWIMDNSFLAQRIQGYKQEFRSIINTSQQYTLMYQIYSCLVKDYYIKKHPEQTEMVRNMSAAFLNNYYKTSEQKFLDQFLQLYLTQIHDQPNYQLNYNIDFDHFSISSTTNLPTLIDFVENAKKHIVNSDYQFMLKNYNNYRDLTIKFQTSTKSEQKIIQIVEEYKKYYWILITITSTCLIAIIFFLVKIQSSIKSAYSLIERIPISELKQNLVAFQIRKQRIMDIFFLSNSDLIKKKAIAMRSGSNTNPGTMTSFNSDVSYNTNELNEDLTYFLDNQYTYGGQKNTKQLQSYKQMTNDSHQTHQQDDALFKKQKDAIKQQKAQTSRMIQESFIVKLCRKSLFIVLFFIFNGIFILNYISLINEKDAFMQILQIQKTFYGNLIGVKRVTIDSPIRAVMEDYFQKPIPSYFTSEINLLASLPNKMILSEMQGFAQTVHQALQQSMCKYTTQYVGTVAMCKECETYLNGVVTKGFRQTYDVFMNNAKLLSQQSLSQFGTYPCTAEKCPPYFQNEFVTLMLGQTTRYMINFLRNSTNDAFEKMKYNLKIQTVVKMIGMIIVAVIYYIFDERLKRRCRKAIQYFRIIPKKIMCSMKMTSYIRKNNILSKLQIL